MYQSRDKRNNSFPGAAGNRTTARLPRCIRQEPSVCVASFPQLKRCPQLGQALSRSQSRASLGVAKGAADPPDAPLAAWTAIDASELDNGCLYVVPGSHRKGLLCPAEG